MNTESLTRTDRQGLAIAEFVTRHPGWVMLITTVLMLAAASGVRHLNFANNYRVFFSSDNPELVAFEDLQATYTKNDNILFVVQPKNGAVFTPQVAQAIESLTRDAWKIPFAIRVDSITNFQHSWADGDELTVEDLIRDGAGLPQAVLERKRAVALAEPLLNGNLISPDADTTGVNVTLQYPEQSLTEVPQAVAFARALAADIESHYPQLTVAITGVSMLNNAFAEAGQLDAMNLIPFMYLVLLGAMLVVFRSVSATAGTLLVIAFATATAVGIAGYLGYTLDPISVTGPIIILTLAIADSVHLLVTMLNLMRDGQQKLAALKDSLRINYLAISITSLTTTVGFLALNFSDAPPFWYLGNITAIGIAAAWLFSLFFLPAFLTRVPIHVKPRPSAHDTLSTSNSRMARFARTVTAHHRKVLLASLAVAFTLIAFLPRVELNDEWVKYFDQRVQFRNDADFAMQHLTGLYLIEYSLTAAGPGAISDPAYLRRLQEFTGWLRQQPEVVHVYSYSDVIKRLNKNLHGDDPRWYRLPEQRETAAQYLLLYELSLPYGLDLNDRINVDKSATRVTATLAELSTVQVRAFLDRAERWLHAHAPAHMQVDPTGATVMFSYISQRNIESMLGGNAVAVVLIALIMVLSLRSLGLGLLSLIPNTVPILMTFGAWGLLVGQVGMAAATVSATSLGIIVDNTVHFLTKYLRARREGRLQRPQAIEYAFDSVGTAIIWNTLILAFGFAVLTTSTFRVNVEMGLLTSMAIVIALVVDFLLLPALLMVGYRKREGETDENTELALAR